MISALFDDHYEAFLVWREAGLSGLTCVHVDAHLDVSADGFSEQALQGIAQARTREEITAFRGNPKLPWGGFHCGNYLFPALLDGTISTFIWVVPAGFAEGSLVQNARQTLQNWLDMRLEDFRSLQPVEGRVEGQLLGRRLVICTSDNLPRLSPEEAARVALDIDVDYFVSLKDDALWQTPHQLRQQLSELQPLALTVATSCEGGYTPLSHRWLGQVCLEVFTGHPQAWRAETEQLGLALRAAPQEARPPASRDSKEEKDSAGGPDGVPEGSTNEPGEAPSGDTSGTAEGGPMRSPEPQRLEVLERYLDSLPELFRPGLLCALGRHAEAAALDPQYRFSPFDEAGRLFQKGRHAEGLACLEKCGDQALERGFLVALLAAGAAESGLSLEQFDKLLALPGLTPRDTARLLVMQAQLLADQQPRKALEVLRRAAQLEPGRANVHFQLGVLQRKLGRRDEAARSFRKALRLAKGRVSSLAILLEVSRLYDELGQKALARATRRELEEADVTGYYAIQSILDTSR
jgi:tetratricopeptide (TPR) repeat protein